MHTSMLQLRNLKRRFEQICMRFGLSQTRHTLITVQALLLTFKHAAQNKTSQNWMEGWDAYKLM